MTTDYQQTFYAIAKRSIDVVAGVIGILVFGVPMLIAYVALKAEHPGPAVFVQKRVGREGKLFRMYKFASMITRTEEEEKEFFKKWQKENPELWERYKASNFKLENDPRITKLGKFIRRTSIDELPQFFNILKGEMSLVGPRAYKPDELKSYETGHPEVQKDVKVLTTVKPGLTGLWQVSGRSEVDFRDRVKLDAEYARRKSLLEDIKIIFKTPIAVFKKDGAY